MKLKPTQTKRILLACTALALCLLAAAVFLGRHQNGTAETLNDLQLQVGSGSSAYTLNLWRENQPEDGGETTAERGDGWFFVPAYADLSAARLLYNGKTCTVILDEVPKPSGVRLNTVANGSVCTLTFIGPDGAAESIPLHFAQSQNLPALFLTTQSGSMADIRADKSYREAGALKLVKANGKVDCSGALEYLKGRGNQTWQLDKRGYGFKLAESSGLLGMEKAKKWVLLANAFDDSMLRNRLAYDMADALDLPYTPQTAFCDLYLNGTYAGTYQLAEKVEIGESRVNITDLEEENRKANPTRTEPNVILTPEIGWSWTDFENDPADITGGYLLERDYGDKYADENAFFVTDRSEAFVLKSPSNATKTEVEYIDGVMQTLENAIFSEDGTDPATGLHYTDILDLNSWAKLFLLDEFTKNEGGGASSAWYYKDTDSIDGKVYSGPAWDYDKSLGRYARWGSPEGLMLMEYHDSATTWFEYLYKQPEFYEAVTAAYTNVLTPYLQTLLDTGLDACQAEIADSWAMDKARWGSYYGWLRYFNDASTLDHCTDYLRSWITQRMDFLNSAWVDGQQYYCVKLDGGMRSTAYYYLYAKAGEPLTYLPEGKGGEGEFLYWVLEGTDTVVDTTTPITADCRLESVWSGEGEESEE